MLRSQPAESQNKADNIGFFRCDLPEKSGTDSVIFNSNFLRVPLDQANMLLPVLYSWFFVCWTASAAALPVPGDWRNRLDKKIYELYRNRTRCSTINLRSRKVFFQGDIQIDEGFLDGSRKFTGEIFPQQFWEKIHGQVIVPYVITPSFDISEVQMIEAAMNGVTEKVSMCIRFKERTDEDDYVEIVLPPITTMCSSIIGRHGGKQTLNLGKECLVHGIIQHELMHALGIFHEQSRPDRDYYVVIFEENVYPGTISNFQVLPKMATYGVTYDIGSVMHYSWNDLSIDSDLPTILPRDPNAKARMGQRDGLTNSDAAKLKRAYECEEVLLTRTTTKSPSSTTNKPATRTTTASTRTTKKVADGGSLPVFELNPISTSECAQLDTPNCDVSQGSTNCFDSILHVSCSLLATNQEIELVFKKFKKLSRSRPLTVELQGYRQLTPALFVLVKEFIIELTIGFYDNVHLAPLDLPNLLGLGFWECNSVKITLKTVKDYKNLRVLEFGKSTVSSIDKQALEELTQLKILALDHGLEKPLTTRQVSHLRRFHCSCDYAWLRRWLDQQPQVIESKAWGELHKYGNRGSISYPKESMFRSVDCSKSDAEMVLTKTSKFSINAGC